MLSPPETQCTSYDPVFQFQTLFIFSTLLGMLLACDRLVSCAILGEIVARDLKLFIGLQIVLTLII